MSEDYAGETSSFESPVVARAKLLPPRLRLEAVPRPALVDAVQDSTCRLTTISGPAGSGKSTLMAQCHAAATKAVWLTLDRADNDPVVLWWSLIEGLAGILPGFGNEYRHRLMTGGAAVLDDIVSSVANELATRRGPVQLFIDDVHVLEDATCLRSIHALVTQVPAEVRVVLASRTINPIPVARFRVEGDLLQISADQLALSELEAQQLLAGLGAILEPAPMRILVERTEGWPAGLHLAAMALARSGDPDDFVQIFRGTDRDVSDYLVAEVLETVGPEEQRFMMETSILERLSGELCDSVTGLTDSGQHLRRLEESNAFVVPLDRVGSWYRYHHLFAEVLASQLARRGKSDVQQLHSRAFDWYCRHGFIDDAIGHGLAAGRVDEAGDLVCRYWFELLNTGRIRTALGLVERFSPEQILEHQPLTNAAALIHAFAGDLDQARQYLDAAGRGSADGPAPDGAASLKSSLALAKASLALDGVSQAEADAELAFELEPPDSPWRPLAALIVGLARMMKDDVSGASSFLDIAFASPDEAISTYAQAELALGLLEHGEIDQAGAMARDAGRRVRETGLDDLISAATIFATEALTSLAADNRQQAAFALDSAARPIEIASNALPMDAMNAQILLADAALELGRDEVAMTYLNRATRLAATFPDTGAMNAKLNLLRARYKQSDREPASDQGESSPFTEREIAVLALLPTGLTTREIGEELFLSRNTIKTYMRRAYRKLGVSSRAEAIDRARDIGLLPAE
ncbi:MAG: LuxR C-terminal-related transcriptional regulator [Acidimicrobiales bacterium]